MPEYKCERCGWTTRIKTQLGIHLFRLKPCNPKINNISNKELIMQYFPELIEQYEDKLKKKNNNSILNCKFCNKNFSSKQSRWFHEKNCSFILKDNEKSLVQKLKEKDEIIKHQQELLEIAKETCKKSNNIINSNNTTNTNFNIQINAFGNENLSHISKTFLTSLLKIPYSSIPKLLEKIHFNNEFPQNQNIKIVNRKEKWALKFNGKEWEFVPKTTVINDMISNGVNILENHFEENAQDELTDTKKERWNKFSDEINDQNNPTLKRIFDDTECLILNKSNKNKPIVMMEAEPIDDYDENIELIIDDDDDDETINIL